MLDRHTGAALVQGRLGVAGVPDCKETSAQVPLYNEIQATTTFASLALIFFFCSLHKSGAAPGPGAWPGPRRATSRDSSAPRSIIGVICNIISGAQLKGSFRGTSGARLVPRVRARSADPRRRENAIATSARGRQTSTSINYAGGPATKAAAPPKLSQRNSGIAAAALMRAPGAHRMRLQLRASQRRNFLIIRVNVSGEGRLLPLRRALQVCANLRAGYIIEKMPPANRQLGRGLVDEFSPTALTPQVKIHGCAAPFPESCTRQQLSPVIASFQSRRLACRVAVFKLRSRFALARPR